MQNDPQRLMCLSMWSPAGGGDAVEEESLMVHLEVFSPVLIPEPTSALISPNHRAAMLSLPRWTVLPQTVRQTLLP